MIILCILPNLTITHTFFCSISFAGEASIITYVLAKCRNRQVPVCIRCTNFAEGAIEDKVVGLRPETYGVLLPQQGECEIVAVMISDS